MALYMCVAISACGRIGYESRPGADESALSPEAPSVTVSPEEEVSLETEEDPCLEAPFGDGKDGVALFRSGTRRIINESSQISAPLGEGSDEFSSADIADLAAIGVLRRGSVLLFWQTQLPIAVARGGNDVPRDPSTPPSFGYYETHRVAEVADDRVRLCAPLASAYTRGAQLVAVPQYVSMVVQSDAEVTADAWNGMFGGLLAFMVQGALTLDGRLSMSGLGFRGGEYVNREETPFDCGSQDFGNVGEGFASGDEVLGTANYGSGGGAAICINDGGGGGGGWGAGGSGGRTGGPQASEGGQGVTSAPQHLVLGGGGGAGSGEDNAGSSGARGGGALWIRAAIVEGSGAISASGSAAGPGNVGGDDGAGGGGGGGAINLIANELELDCARMDVRGGAGGDTNGGHGGGGGGGGGLVRLAGAFSGAADCNPPVAGGRAGFPEASPTPSAPGLPGHFERN